jgi:uncharacterized membrane protein YphA (DoxX/SURF4 family)
MNKLALILMWSCRILIAGVLVWAAMAKIFAPPSVATLYEQWVATYAWARYVVPAMELLLGAWVLSGLRPGLAACFTIALLSGFSGILIAELGKDHPKPCGCFGGANSVYDPNIIRMGLIVGLARNVLIIAGMCYLFLAVRGRTSGCVGTMPATGSTAEAGAKKEMSAVN